MYITEMQPKHPEHNGSVFKLVFNDWDELGKWVHDAKAMADLTGDEKEAAEVQNMLDEIELRAMKSDVTCEYFSFLFKWELKKFTAQLWMCLVSLYDVSTTEDFEQDEDIDEDVDEYEDYLGSDQSDLLEAFGRALDDDADFLKSCTETLRSANDTIKNQKTIIEACNKQLQVMDEQLSAVQDKMLEMTGKDKPE